MKPLGWVWFSGLLLGMTACLPYIIEYLCSKQYATHRHGVVFVTGATSTVGKASCLALLADGYTVGVSAGMGEIRDGGKGHIPPSGQSPALVNSPWRHDG